MSPIQEHESDRDADPSANEIKELVESGITQKVTRAKRDGLDCVNGLYRLDFESDQHRHPINIPIHPPFVGVPAVEAETLFVTSRIRVTNAEKFGVRLEVILNETCLLYTSPSPRDLSTSRMPSSA